MVYARTSRVVGNDPESRMSNAESTEVLRAEIAERKAEVRTLDRQRAASQGELRRLEAEQAALEDASPVASSDATGSGRPVPATAAEKVALFRSLFRGRDDVYPKLWVNAKSGRTGYAPACANEWVRGVCEKPRVRCGDCPNQAFLTVSDRVIADHLQGRHVVGVSRVTGPSAMSPKRSYSHRRLEIPAEAPLGYEVQYGASGGARAPR